VSVISVVVVVTWHCFRRENSSLSSAHFLKWRVRLSARVAYIRCVTATCEKPRECFVHSTRSRALKLCNALHHDWRTPFIIRLQRSPGCFWTVCIFFPCHVFHLNRPVCQNSRNQQSTKGSADSWPTRGSVTRVVPTAAVLSEKELCDALPLSSCVIGRGLNSHFESHILCIIYIRVRVTKFRSCI